MQAPFDLAGNLRISRTDCGSSDGPPPGARRRCAIPPRRRPAPPSPPPPQHYRARAPDRGRRRGDAVPGNRAARNSGRQKRVSVRAARRCSAGPHRRKISATACRSSSGSAISVPGADGGGSGGGALIPGHVGMALPASKGAAVQSRRAGPDNGKGRAADAVSACHEMSCFVMAGPFHTCLAAPAQSHGAQAVWSWLPK